MLQRVKRAARGFRTVKNFVAIAYRRLSKLKNLQQQSHATSRAAAIYHLPCSRKIERNIVSRTSHYMGIPTIIARSDLMIVSPRPVANAFVARRI